MRIRFRHAFAGIVAVLIFQAFAIACHLYNRQPNLDIPMHFAGGFVTALLAIAIQHEFKKVHRIKHVTWWHELLFVIGFVALVAVGWEFFEFLVDSFWQRQLGFVSQISIQDTMGDLAMGLIGGGVAHVLFRPGLDQA